jgi:hypothetical protein
MLYRKLHRKKPHDWSEGNYVRNPVNEKYEETYTIKYTIHKWNIHTTQMINHFKSFLNNPRYHIHDPCSPDPCSPHPLDLQKVARPQTHQERSI